MSQVLTAVEQRNEQSNVQIPFPRDLMKSMQSSKNKIKSEIMIFLDT